MKRVVCLILILWVPITGFSKYCPTCFETYQVQTIRGQAKLLYQWSVSVFSHKQVMQSDHFKHLFDRQVKITINGTRVASGINAAYQYYHSRIKVEKILASHLRNVLTDHQKAVLQYQSVVMDKQHKKRVYTIAILEFNKHKLIRWDAVTYSRTIK